jgi:predicted DNA-binding protein YlxM (UPF0122 family)
MIGASKLTKEQVAEIKTLFATTNLNDAEIAEMFNVSRAHINQIKRGQRWNDLERSFVMKEDIKEEEETNNFIILHLVDYQDRVLVAKHITPDEMVSLRDYITRSYINQSKGITTILEIPV